jgi:hypothetical protein
MVNQRKTLIYALKYTDANSRQNAGARVSGSLLEITP